MKSKFVTILFLVIFWPIGLLLMWKNKHFSKVARIVISSIFSFLLVLSFAIGSNSGEETKSMETTTKVHEEKKEIEKPKVEKEAPKKEVIKKETPKKESPKSSLTLSQKNAISKAESYLDFMGFSKTGLIKQLEFDGFSKEDATYAVNNIDVNWKEQAYKKGKEYLNTMSFSRSGLIKQLKFDGFSDEESTYAVDQIGL